MTNKPENQQARPSMTNEELAEAALAAIKQQQEQNNAKPDNHEPRARMTAEALKGGGATCNVCEAVYNDVRGGYCPSLPNPSTKQTEGK